MKKSKEISKYSAKWQLLRASVKGSKFSCEEKVDKVLTYLSTENTVDAWERVYNFLEGLQRGYISSNDLEKIEYIHQHLEKLNSYDKSSLKKEDSDESFELHLLEKSSFKDRYHLYKDLFNRSKKWLKNGYLHEEQENFIDMLIHVFIFKGESSLIKENYSFEKLEDLRDKSSFIKNKHQFFF